MEPVTCVHLSLFYHTRYFMYKTRSISQQICTNIQSKRKVETAEILRVLLEEAY